MIIERKFPNLPPCMQLFPFRNLCCTCGSSGGACWGLLRCFCSSSSCPLCPPKAGKKIMLITSMNRKSGIWDITYVRLRKQKVNILNLLQAKCTNTLLNYKAGNYWPGSGSPPGPPADGCRKAEHLLCPLCSCFWGRLDITAQTPPDIWPCHESS